MQPKCATMIPHDYSSRKGLVYIFNRTAYSDYCRDSDPSDGLNEPGFSLCFIPILVYIIQ